MDVRNHSPRRRLTLSSSSLLLLFCLSFFVLLFLLVSPIQASPSPPSPNDDVNDGQQQQQQQQYFSSIRSIDLSHLNSTFNLSAPVVANLAYASDGRLFVAAENWLFKLNAVSLSVERAISYGPVLDSPACRYAPVEECSQPSAAAKTLMNNHNKLLIFYERRNAVLSCWSARQGTCDLRDADTLELVQASSVPVVANDAVNSTIGFIAAAPNSQDLFYVASTYTSQGPYRYEVPALSGRSLNIPTSSSSSSSSSLSQHKNGFMSVLTYSQGLKSSKASVEFMSRFQKSFIVKYVSAFNLGIYNYFLTVQHMDTEANARGDLLQTKLARLCLNDLSFTKSYVEIPLRCSSRSGGSISSLRSIDYNELIAARVLQLRTRALEPSETTVAGSAAEPAGAYIVGLFQQTTRTNFNASLDQATSEQQSIKQAVCMFPLRQVQARIRENLVKCYDSSSSSSRAYEATPLMRGLNFIKPDQQCNSQFRARGFQARSQAQFAADWASSASSSVGDDFCSSADNELYPIGGQIAASASAVLEFDSATSPDSVFDAVQAWSDPVATTLQLVSGRRRLVKLYHVRSLGNGAPVLVNYRTVRLPGARSDRTSSAASAVFEHERGASPPSLFVATRSQVHRIRLSACDAFKTCNECLLNSMPRRDSSSGGGESEAGDPYCGWCSATSQCSTQAQCPRPDGKWLHGGLAETNSSFATALDALCVDIARVQPAEVYRESAEQEWIQIDFRKELAPRSEQSSLKNQTSSVYQCVFLSPPATGSGAAASIQLRNAELRTDAVQVALDRLKCPLPHLSKLQPLFPRNEALAGPDPSARLVASEDGLFRMPSNGVYYYERLFDRLSLPLYVENIVTVSAHGSSKSLTTVRRYGYVKSASDEQQLQTSAAMFNVSVVDCGAHRSCISCTMAAAANCMWCESRCVRAEETSTGRCVVPETTTAENSTAVSTACPLFDTGTSKLLIPFTAHRQQAPVTFTLANVDSTSNLTCMLTLFNGRFTGRNVSVPFVALNRTHAQCSLNAVFAELEPFLSVAVNGGGDEDSRGQVQTDLRLYDSTADVFVDSVTNGRLALLFYKCELKATAGSECGQCLALNRQLSCMWCQGECRFMNAQSKQAQALQCVSASSSSSSANGGELGQCDKPQILAIQPAKVAARTSATLTISGVNLGKRFEDVAAVSLLCGGDESTTIACELEPGRYVPSKQIVCHTQPLDLADSPFLVCRLRVRLINRLMLGEDSPLAAAVASGYTVSSSQTVAFVRPVIVDVQPATIIQSANFVWLTLRGSDLDAGRFRRVLIADHEEQPSDNFDAFRASRSGVTVRCDVKNVTSAEIRCRLNEKFRSLGKKYVRLYLDEADAAESSQVAASLAGLRVTADPLIKSIDKHVTIYAGGTRFTLHGYNFLACQSVYTYITYRDLWYSEPVPARIRLSNEQIVFEFPALNEAFFQLVRLSPEYGGGAAANGSRYELLIGFIMDGFNVTLRNSPVTYVPDFADSQLSVRDTLIVKETIDSAASSSSSAAATASYSMVLDLELDETVRPLVASRGPLHHDLQVFVGCSPCAKLAWTNSTRVHCQLPSLVASAGVADELDCEPKVLTALLAELRLRNRLALVNVFVGNQQIRRLEQTTSEENDNVALYLKMYMINNVGGGFVRLANELAERLESASTGSATVAVANRTVQALRLRQPKLILERMDAGFTFAADARSDGGLSAFSLAGRTSSATVQNALFVATVVVAVLILVGLGVILVARRLYRLREKRSNGGLDAGATGFQFSHTHHKDSAELMNDSAAVATLKRSRLFVLGGSRTAGSASKRAGGHANGTATCRSRKSTKQLMAEYEQIREFVEGLEAGLRGQSGVELDQLFAGYVNELDQDLVYSGAGTIGRLGTTRCGATTGGLHAIFQPYRSFLASFLFPASSAAASSWPASFAKPTLTAANGLLAIDMSAAGMGQCSAGSGATSSSGSGDDQRPSMPQSAAAALHQHQQHMTQSSLSNSTTNTFLSISNAASAATAAAAAQPYATIKSSGGLGLGGQPRTHNMHILDAMQLFDQLLHNKTFLVTFVRVCEQSNKSPLFTLRDRMRFAALLTVALKDNLPYLYSIIKALLSDYIASAASGDGQKLRLLFRTNESLVEPLLANWLAIFMHDYHLNTPQTSLSLFRLVKVVRAYLDMGACDEQTQQAAHTLNEERLLKSSLPAFGAVQVNVINCLNLPHASPTAAMMFTIRLLECDTVRQAKEKIVDYLLYKLTLILNRGGGPDKTVPLLSPADVDLELCLTVLNAQQTAMATTLLMKDVDDDDLGGAEVKRLLTLKDYNVVNGSCINLTLKYHLRQQQQQQQSSAEPSHEDANQHIYMSTLSMSNEYLLYAPSTIARQPPPLPPSLPPLNSTSQLKRPAARSYHLVKPAAAASASDGSKSSASSSASASLTKSSNDGLIPSVVLDIAKTSKKAKKAKKNGSKQVNGGATSANTAVISRLLLTKTVLRPFINDFFESLFDRASVGQLPPVIPHLFEFLDQEAAKSCPGAAEQLKKTTRLWKTNILLLRYWTNLLKNPHYLFAGTASVSADKTVLVDSTMSCIAQLLLDSCSQEDPYNLYDTHSPVNRLLFVNEVPRYREIIGQFFDALDSSRPVEQDGVQQPSISDHELHFYMNEFAKLKQHAPAVLTTQMATGLVEEASQPGEPGQIDTLLHLYEYYEKYEQAINANLGQQQCSILLPVHHRLVQIKDLMMTSSSSTALSPAPPPALNAAAATPAGLFGNTLARSSGGQAFMLSFANQPQLRFQPAPTPSQAIFMPPHESSGCYATTIPLQQTNGDYE